ncbi:hypothetical protein D3C72_1777290 [compost metagenome]
MLALGSARVANWSWLEPMSTTTLASGLFSCSQVLTGSWPFLHTAVKVLFNRGLEKFTTSWRCGVGARANIRSILLDCRSSTELPQVVSTNLTWTPSFLARLSPKSGPKPSHFCETRSLLK